MKRRRFFTTLAALPAAPALMAQTQTTQPQSTPDAKAPPTPPVRPPNGPRGDIFNFEETAPELAASTEPRFFTPAQFAALRRLSALLMPPMGGSPGAVDCGAPEFLDFLIGASLPDRQKLYRTGLDTLDAKAKKSQHKTFAELTDAEADAVVRPLLVPVAWAPDAPKDPMAQFVTEAHRDIRTATQNSRQWAEAGAASGRRRGGGGTYLNPIDPVYRS